VTEVLHSARDVPPEQKDQGHIILSDSHVNADVQELVELGEVHMKLVIEFYSKAKAMLQGTSAVRDVMVEHPNSSAPPEGTCKGSNYIFQLQITTKSLLNKLDLLRVSLCILCSHYS
jgi:hypothetical protein